MLTSFTRSLGRSALRFYRREDGVTAVECALLLALVVTICVVSLTPFNKDGANPEPIVVIVQDS